MNSAPPLRILPLPARSKSPSGRTVSWLIPLVATFTVPAAEEYTPVVASVPNVSDGAAAVRPSYRVKVASDEHCAFEVPVGHTLSHFRVVPTGCGHTVMLAE